MSNIELTDSVKQQIDHWLSKYPPEHRQSAVLPALHVVQDDMGGHLTDELIAALANYLQLPKIVILEAATFYSMYEHSPVGKHKICVCTNVSCKLKGADHIVKHLNEKLGIQFGETTDDGQYTLKEVECLGACIGAPMFQINKDYYENLTTKKVDQILDNLEQHHGE